MNNVNQIDTSRHPCFNKEVKGKFGRIHLPVAPLCNIQCNYCNRKYDCVNESRPGVTSAVLKPSQAMAYMEKVIEKESRITTVGIAGPGDPLANPAETLTTLKLIRKKWPHMLICLSSNGLNLPFYLDDLAEIGTSHVTLTINAVNPEIGRHFYSWIRDNKIVYRGYRAAELLLERQLESIRGLKERGIIVKVNTIIVPWMNDQHSLEVAEKVSHMGVDMHNCMPMYPNPGTLFEHIPEPSTQLINLIREECEHHIPQMRHCARCRSDAVGLLGQDQSEQFSSCLVACSKKVVDQSNGDRPYVAVATQEGALINEHLGRASTLYIYKQNDDNFELLEMRKTPEPGDGGKRWFELAEKLNDCQAILVSAIGETPRTILEEEGLRVLEMYGVIEDGLDAAFSGKEVRGFQKRRMSCSAEACIGSGGGCG